jgi:hypothetical protein
MTNIVSAVARGVTCDEEEEHCCYYSWLEDYFERLEGKDAYREFQEHHLGAREEYRYALIGSLLA